MPGICWPELDAYRVVGYDPLARETARHELADKAVVLEDLRACLEQADAVVIATPDLEFRALRSADFPIKEPRLIVLDCWRILRQKLGSASHVSYIGLGIGAEEDPGLEGRLKELWARDGR
jgi:UDP-N-acetyl-D-mannosaminuronate dehydrogenase